MISKYSNKQPLFVSLVLHDSPGTEELLLWTQICSTVAWVLGSKHNQLNQVKKLKIW